MNIVSRTVAMLVRAAALCASGAALAQESPASADLDSGLAEVHVTGSRIQRDGMTTPTPVTALNLDDLHVMAPTTIAAAVTQLPQFINSSVPEGAPSAGWTGASGASILNLRGVGQNRTLVLLDGRRVVASTRRGTLDVNLMPDALVKSVEVVTGGASAAYGSDAVSGVVNFILDTKFEGIKTDIGGGVTELGDNKNYSASLAGGFALGSRAHVIASVDYFTADPITNPTRRDWQNSSGVITNPLASQPGQPARITRPNVRSTQFTEGGLIVSGPLAWTQFLPGGVEAPFVKGADFTTSAQSGGDGQDLSWYNYVTPDAERGSAFTHVTFDLNDSARVFVQGLYGVNNTSYLAPPAGGQLATWQLTIFGDNAFLPASTRSRLAATSTLPLSQLSFKMGRAGDLDYGASKEIEQQNTLKSVTTGIKADVGDWKLDGYYQYGRTDSNINMDNAIRLDRVYQAIDAVRDPSGNIVCNSTLRYPGNGCVPLNVFGVGSPSQAAIDWITQDISQKQIVQQHVVDVSISGEAFQNWAGPVSMAFGASWRHDWFTQHVYPVELHEGKDMPVIGPTLGYRGLPAVYSGNANIFERGPSASPSGGYKVKEGFAEMQFPLLSEKPAAKGLDLNTAVRLADYEGSGKVWAWKGGLDWSINDDIRFRLTRSRDIRAGSLSERFDTSRGPGTVTDSQSGSSLPYAVTVIAGGNPNVDPELADTLTFGVVLRPSWLEGFAMSVDAYDVKIKGAIGQLGPQAIVEQCSKGATQLCDYFSRGSDGFISTLYNLFINTAEARTKGIDFELSYARPITLFGGDERITARLLATHLTELSTTQAGAAKVDRAGQTGGPGAGGTTGGAPDWQGTVSLSYLRGPISATLQERYINSGTYDATYVQGVDIDDNTIASTAYTNLEISYRGAMRGEAGFQTYLNVTNLFDRTPPLVATWGFTGSQQTNSSLFDIYGRRYNLGVRFNF